MKGIEQVLGVSGMAECARGAYTYVGDVTLAGLRALVDVREELAWQDPQSPDCHNDDGMYYIIYMDNEIGEVMVGIDPLANIIYIS